MPSDSDAELRAILGLAVDPEKEAARILAWKESKQCVIDAIREAMLAEFEVGHLYHRLCFFSFLRVTLTCIDAHTFALLSTRSNLG